MAKKIYIVDHYIPFPSSEYGGVWNVIAENDDECFDLITAEDDDNFYEKFYSNLKENIINARSYDLADDVESEVVESFTT
jgi:hypothetical protein